MLKTYKKCKAKLDTVSSIEERLRINIPFADEKLDFFYTVCLPSVSKADICGGNIKKRRQDREEEIILANGTTQGETVLDGYKQLLENNCVEAIMNSLNDNKEMDTSGFFRSVSVSKLETQTNIYARLLTTLKSEYEELLSISEKMNTTLDYVRSCAYRNLYLGSELINIVRNNGGGGKLEKQEDFLSVGQLNLSAISTDVRYISYDYGQIISYGMSNFYSLFKNKSFQPFISKNPKTGVAIAVLNGALNAIENYNHQRNIKIEKLLDRQKKLVKAFDQLHKYYQSQLPKVIRSVELAYSIIQMNKGFMKFYAPLRDKVYQGDANISKKEIIELAYAMKEYNNVAKSSL